MKSAIGIIQFLLNQLKKKALVYYIHQSDAYIKAYVQQHL